MPNYPTEAPELRLAGPVSLRKPAPTTFADSFQSLACLVAVACGLTAGLRWLFFHFSAQIWGFSADFPMAAITPWARWAMKERDGAEPQVLLLLTLVLIALTTVAKNFMDRVSVTGAAGRLFVAAMCLTGIGIFCVLVPFAPPVAQIGSDLPRIFLVVAALLLIAAAAQWAGSRLATSSLLLLLLIPVCFLPAAPVSMSDLSCILAPALRLRLGFPVRDIYFQYDLFPSLIAMGWHRLGADLTMFSFCTGVSYLLLFAGCFLLARRLFADPRLPALLLVALCAVRVYGIWGDANAYPQVTPLRTDFWIVPLVAALYFGLEHWTVGLATGLVFFFLRGFGMLYLGSYALALVAEFLARRAASAEPPPLFADIVASMRRLLPSLAFVATGIVAVRLVFGSFISEAVVMYHRLGPGMMRIAPGSFYWWIAPGVAITAAVAFRCRRFLPERHGQAALFAIALAVGNCIYFFGRSHENNLMNVSASLLLVFFLGIDLAALTLAPGPSRSLVLAIPLFALTVIAFFYSGRIFEKVGRQFSGVAQVAGQQDSLEPVVCAEINAAAPDHRVFIFSINDYWYYERCGYVPQGYIQPFFLQILRWDAITQMNRLLDRGYKLVVPKMSTPGFDWAEFSPALNEMHQFETANYLIFERRQ